MAGTYDASLTYSHTGGTYGAFSLTEVGRSTCQGALYDPQGVPRFPPELYAQIRDALYALAIADGYIVPVTP